MGRGRRGATVLLTAACALAAAAWMPETSAQNKTAGSRSVKKLSDGQPDIQGTYISGWSVPIERYTEAERKAWIKQMEAVRGPDPGAYGLEWTEINLQSKTRRPPAGTVQVIDPPDGRIPWQPWALAKKNYIRDNPYERHEFIDSRVRCLPAGPRFTLVSAYNGWQILQTPGHVIFLQEHNHNYRVIPLSGQHPPASVQLWQGDSRGRWEGNTLVVDVTNFTDKTWIVGEAGGEGMSGGSFHSTALHMVERFTIVDADNIDYEATVEDPNVFTRPWKLAFGVWTRAPRDYENYEFACHEGNRSVELTEVLFKKPGATTTPPKN
jgi:hypothetical protein